LFARLVRFNNNKERWIAFVGLLDGKPYEIFTGRLEDIKIPLKVEEGEIVKVRDEEGKKRYDFEYEEGTLEGIDGIFDNGFWNYAKLVSGMLRHGMPLHFAVDMVSNMSFPEDHINTWKNGVARTLKKFIPDGKAEGMKCNDCASTNVIFQEGCSSCLDCGSSKCG
jgi:ribonucleoside-diphosphate reductase alpha chain